MVYPALRPYSSETGLPGAQAFASWRRTASHVSAIGGLVVLTQLPQLRRLAPIGHVGPTLVAIGAALVLPYYGAEAFGVGAVGRQVITTGDTSGLAAVEAIRYGVPALVLFGAGLILMACGGVVVGRALWRGPTLTARGAGLLLVLGLVLFLPQFYFPPVLRMAHGVVLGAGLVLLATVVSSRNRHQAAD